MASPWTPDPGSLAAKVLALFARNPDQRYTPGQLATLMDASPQQLAAGLTSALTIGLVAHDRKLGETVKHYGRGGKLTEWLEVHGVPMTTKWPRATPAPIAPPVPPVHESTAPVPETVSPVSATPSSVPKTKTPVSETTAPAARRGRYAAAQSIDVDKLVSYESRPKPPRRIGKVGGRQKGSSVYAQIWEKVLTKVGSSTDLTKAQARGLSAWAIKNGHRVSVRPLFGTDMYGVWREADPKASTRAA